MLLCSLLPLHCLLQPLCCSVAVQPSSHLQCLHACTHTRCQALHELLWVNHGHAGQLLLAKGCEKQQENGRERGDGGTFHEAGGTWEGRGRGGRGDEGRRQPQQQWRRVSLVNSWLFRAVRKMGAACTCMGCACMDRLAAGPNSQPPGPSDLPALINILLRLPSALQTPHAAQHGFTAIVKRLISASGYPPPTPQLPSLL